MKKSKYREEKTVLYRAQFGLADRTPSTFTIYRFASEIAKCHGSLDETEAMSTYTFDNFSEALEHLSELIVTGRHKGHRNFAMDYCQSD